LSKLLERAIDLHDLSDRVRLFGEYDRNLSAIESALGVSVHADNDRLLLAGDPADVERAEHVVRRVLDAAVNGAHITPDDVALVLADVRHDDRAPALPKTLLRTQRGAEVRPRTAGQRAFVDSIERHTLTIGIGPAGTGKTYLAIVMAVRGLKNRDVSRVILSRPAVEAGENLGFLPGDLREKVDPYMRPLFDALNELLDEGVTNRYIDRGTLEVAPLAYMRGRTLSDAFVILDEAQNATSDQLKMFLTRLGAASKMVVTGDVTQVDLPVGTRSGLRDAADRLAAIDGVSVVELDENDVVRHPLVSHIIRAYARRPTATPKPE
jgi:phosphate starvation-inducible PhoH-like protein